MKITLRGEVREYEAPMTALELAASLSQALKKEALDDRPGQGLRGGVPHLCG